MRRLPRRQEAVEEASRRLCCGKITGYRGPICDKTFCEGDDVRCEKVTRAGHTNENSKQKNKMSVLRRSQNKGINLRALEKE